VTRSVQFFVMSYSPVLLFLSRLQKDSQLEARITAVEAKSDQVCHSLCAFVFACTDSYFLFFVFSVQKDAALDQRIAAVERKSDKVCLLHQFKIISTDS